MPMGRNVSSFLRFRVQSEVLLCCKDPNIIRSQESISKALRQYEIIKIKKYLGKGFYNSEKYNEQCLKVEELQKNLEEARENVGRMLINRQKDSTAEEYVYSSINSPFGSRNVSDSLFPIGRKVDFFLKQKILKSLFINEEDDVIAL